MKYKEETIYGIIMMENIPHGEILTHSYYYENQEDAEKEADKLSDDSYIARVIEVILRKRGDDGIELSSQNPEN